jgi:APA family basic amino acid/polyamine antiporter
MPKLKKELGLFSTTLYGIGVILGAGIYALIGVGAGFAGNMLWLAFLFSSVIAIFSGLSYAELVSIFPKEAAEYTYTKKAFNKELFSFIIGWILAIGTIIAASTVALGFGGYFSNLFGIDYKLAAVGLVVLMTFLNYSGIRESARFNNFSSLLEAGGLLLVVGAVFLISQPQTNVDLLEFPVTGFQGVITAISVIFFAYIGFENIANLAEEVKGSRKVIPKALVLSLVISTILYILVSIAAVSQVDPQVLAASEAPLTLVVSNALGDYSALLSIIALFVTGNTVLIFLIVASRILYGMSHGGSLPKFFSKIGEQRTPYYSVFIVGVVATLIAYATDIKTVAQLADLGVFIAYLAVNAALIALAGKHIGERRFKSPRLLGIPIFAVLGALSSLFMLYHFEFHLWAMEAVVVVAGAALFFAAKRS